MLIRYAKLSITIQGIAADKEALRFLSGWLREATVAGLLGHQKDSFKYRNEFDSDIEVVIEEIAGEVECED